jgi:hypothetical protein
MPKIRTYEQRTQLSGGPLGGVPTRNAAADTQFVTELGNAAQKIQVSRDAWRLADTSAKAMGELEQFRGELEADEDFDTHAHALPREGARASGQVWAELHRGDREDLPR